MQEQVDMIRVELGEQGVFGVLRIGGHVECLTLEPPEADNEPNRSCIPAGVYRCRRRESRRFGSTWEVLDVPGRSDILFHTGNLATDSRGCVLVGERFGRLHGRRAVLGSRRAMDRLRHALAQAQEFDLRIAVMDVEGSGGGAHG